MPRCLGSGCMRNPETPLLGALRERRPISCDLIGAVASVGFAFATEVRDGAGLYRNSQLGDRRAGIPHGSVDLATSEALLQSSRKQESSVISSSRGKQIRASKGGRGARAGIPNTGTVDCAGHKPTPEGTSPFKPIPSSSFLSSEESAKTRTL